MKITIILNGLLITLAGKYNKPLDMILISTFFLRSSDTHLRLSRCRIVRTFFSLLTLPATCNINQNEKRSFLSMFCCTYFSHR